MYTNSAQRFGPVGQMAGTGLGQRLDQALQGRISPWGPIPPLPAPSVGTGSQEPSVTRSYPVPWDWDLVPPCPSPCTLGLDLCG